MAGLVSPAQASDILSQIGNHADKASDLLSNRASAPENSLNPFISTQNDYDAEISALLDKILKALSDDDLIDMKNKINRLKSDNTKSEMFISDLTIRKIESPVSKQWYEVHKTTKNEIDQQILNKREEIEENTNLIQSLQDEIKARLKNEPSLKNISSEQLDSLFSTVMADSSLELIVVLKNIIGLIDVLKNNLLDSGENIHIAQKYYSIYYFMTEAYVRQHDIVLNRYEQVYEAALLTIINENKKLMAQTKQLPTQAGNYGANYRAQQITDRTAELYLRYLREQRREMEKSRAKAMEMAALAENTYKTVNIAQQLGQVMQENQQEYEQLLSLQIPELINFENKEMEQELLKLTERLQAAGRRGVSGYH
jgi:hypothetical protein